MSPARARPVAPITLLLLACALAGCGHPATREECESIFARSAEIELRAQRITDPAQVAERTAAARAKSGDAILEQCVGRRITDAALACVRKAGTAEEMDKCLD